MGIEILRFFSVKCATFMFNTFILQKKAKSIITALITNYFYPFKGSDVTIADAILCKFFFFQDKK